MPVCIDNAGSGARGERVGAPFSPLRTRNRLATGQPEAAAVVLEGSWSARVLPTGLPIG